MTMVNLFSITLLYILFQCCILIEGNSVAERDLTLSNSQKNALDKFKSQIEPFLVNERFKTEAYLVRWLRAAKWDVKKAEKMILENMRWREQYKMDTITEEDWSDFGEQFPYQISLDRENKPCLFSQFGQWDIRQAIVSGKRSKIQRYIYKMYEDIDSKIAEQQALGNFVTRGNTITDVDGYNLMQHGCVQCIAVYIDIILVMDRYYPGLLDKIVLVNVPSTFEAILNIVKQTMTAETKDAIHVFGKNKEVWQNFLNKLVKSSELPIEFGGEKLNNEF